MIGEYAVEFRAAGIEALKATIEDLHLKILSVPTVKTISFRADTTAVTAALASLAPQMALPVATAMTNLIPRMALPVAQGVTAFGANQPIWISGPRPLPVSIADGGPLTRTLAAAATPAAGRGVLATNVAFTAVTGGIIGAITAGLRGTGEGAQLALHFQLISREIAATFLPAIHLAIDGLSRVLGWFRSLSGEQQLAISRTAGITAAILGLAVVLPRVSAGLSLMGAGFRALTVGNPFVAVVGGLVAVLSRTAEGRRTLLEFGESMMKVGAAVADAAAAIMDILGPAIDALANFLSTTTGKWIAVGAVIAAAVPKIVAGVMAMVAAFTTLKGAIFGALGLIGLIAAFAMAGDMAGRSFVDGLLREFKKGQLTIEEGLRRIREEAELQKAQMDQGERERLELVRKGGGMGFGGDLMEAMMGVFDPDREADRLAKRFQDAAARLGGGGRHELFPVARGFEDLRETYRRLQAAASKADTTEAKEVTLRKVAEAMDKTLHVQEGFLLGQKIGNEIMKRLGAVGP